MNVIIKNCNLKEKYSNYFIIVTFTVYHENMSSFKAKLKLRMKFALISMLAIKIVNRYFKFLLKISFNDEFKFKSSSTICSQQNIKSFIKSLIPNVHFMFYKIILFICLGFIAYSIF